MNDHLVVIDDWNGWPTEPDRLIKQSIDRSTDWLTDCLIASLIDRSIDRSIDWLIDWLIEWVSEWVSEWVFDWLIYWFIDWLIADRLSNSFSFPELFFSCPLAVEFDYLPTHNKAVRFQFSFDHFFGSAEEFLYFHCKMTTCQRKEVPRMTVFNCLTQTQLCPHHKESVVTMGPFMVWPEGCNQGQRKLEMKTGKYDSAGLQQKTGIVV